MFQGGPTGFGDALQDILPDLKSVIYAVASFAGTYLLTRPKQEADIHKTEADTGQIQASIQHTLLTEIDDLVDRVRVLRKQVEVSYDKREAAHRMVNNIITLAELIIEEMKDLGVVQSLKMSAVRILEGLYRVRDRLKEDQEEHRG